MTEVGGKATAQVAEANQALGDELPFADAQDFEDARRGFVGTIDPMRIEAADGRVIWDMEAYAFADGEPPPTANPSLWRQAQLLGIHGLFEVAPGFYQVRGFDLANMNLIEGDDGVIVVDCLISTEAAAAALALYREHRGDRPVTGLVYSHSHIDHFGGAKGVLSEEQIESGEVPVIAPAGFLEHAVSENVYAGIAMGRRAGYMYGALLDPGPAGQLTAGLGPDHLDRDGDADPADARRHRKRPGGGRRRSPLSLPAHARDRGALGDELLLPRPQGSVRAPRTPATPCTTP